MKGLRGTPFDLFGRTEERKMERSLIAQYERDMGEVLQKVRPETLDIAVALAELPLKIRGFGPVKAQNEAKAAKEREALLQQLRSGGAPLLKAAE
jgi:indolepyruvate ferredoxin oxidoreductase